MTNVRSVAITGAGNGIGRETAIFFATQGWTVHASDIDIDSLNALKLEIGETHFFTLLNVANTRQVQDYFERLRESSGHLDVLVNNAGILVTDHFESSSLKDHNRLLEINAKSVMNCTHASLPLLRLSPNKPAVINISSASADRGVPSLASYSASKAFVRSFSQALAIEWRRHSIYVCDVAPYFVATSMTDGRDGVFQLAPITITPADVAKTIWRATCSQSRQTWRVETLRSKVERFALKLLPEKLVKKIVSQLTGY